MATGCVVDIFIIVYPRLQDVLLTSLQVNSISINQGHYDANSKTKQSTRNIKKPTTKQNNQLGT
jgi:hypothetical protein